MMGQGIAMQVHNAMVGTLKEPETARELDGIEQSIRYVVQHMPVHGDYLRQYCPAPA
jgi:tryptophan halogenase